LVRAGTGVTMTSETTTIRELRAKIYRRVGTA
jgi:hypothetical protein